MTTDEQAKEYKEALRYISNAKETLTKAGRDGRYFIDSKYVSSASSTAYKGVLIALDTWLRLKNVEVPKNAVGKNGKKTRKSIEFYREYIGKMDKKLLKDVNGAYENLHLYGYYDGTLVASTIETGFEIANEIIDRIKPHPQMPSVIASRRRGNPPVPSLRAAKGGVAIHKN